jgi:hypothetical protein
VPREIPHLDLEAVEVPLDAREIKAQIPDHVLLEMQNISARAVDEFREPRVQPFLVRTLHPQNGASIHDFSPLRIQDCTRRFIP